LTLNRPEKYNSFNTEMAKTLKQHLETCSQDEGIRCVMLTAEGKAFCAGQDLGEFPDPSSIDFDKIVSENYNPVVKLIREMEKTVVAAVNGMAAGAGANLAIACAIVLAKKSATFVQAFSKISLIPDSGGTFFLPRLIGWQRAAALMFTGEKINAEDAEKMGMIYRSFEDDVFEKLSFEFCQQLAQMPTRGIALTKKLLNASSENNLYEQLEKEKTIQVEAGRCEDFKEGVQAFLEKRPAVFKGK